MADKKYLDADGDFSRSLQMSDMGSHLFCASSEPEALHVPPAPHQIQTSPAPIINDAGHHQASAALDFLSLAIGGPHHQAPKTVDVGPPKMPAPEQAAHGFRDATLVQGSGAGGSSWIHGVLGTENNDMAHFTVHGSDQEQFQHAIIDSMHTGVDGHTQRGDSLYHDLSKRMHELVHSFMASGVEAMKNDNSSERVKDTSPGLCAKSYANITAPPQNNDAQKEVEIGTLNKTLSAPAGNSEEAAPDSSQPDVAVDIPEAFDWAGFHPLILESSQVPEYDGASGTGATMYPSLYDKLRRREQVRHSKMSTDGASKISKKSKKRKEDCTKYPDLTSASFKLLCSKDKTFHKHSSRINELHRKIIELEETATRAGWSKHFFIKQRLDMYNQEKAQLFAAINKGLQQNKKPHNEELQS